MAEEAGSVQLGAFELEAPLGEGGMGTVWRARHRGTGRAVAIKRLTRQRAGDPLWRRLFAREIAAAARLTHPGVIALLDRGEDAEGAPWLAMELAEGGSMQQRLPAAGGWPQVRGWLAELLAALAHAHARGVLHRDIKPANLLFARDPDGRERLRLGDFGIALDEQRPLPTGDAAWGWGTPAFMAPEQFEGSPWPQGPWTDLYAVGCLAARLCGAPPPQPDGRIPTPTIPVPPDLEAWMEGLLHPEPSARFACAADALAALPPAAAATHAPGPAPAPGGDLTATATSASAAPPPPRMGGGGGQGRALPRAPFAPDWRELASERREWHHLADVGAGLLGLRGLPLVGRTEVQDLLWSALRQVREEGASRVVIVQGQAGLGKSRLAAWLTEHAAEAGAASVLYAHHDRDPGPADGLRGMMARALRHPAVLPEDRGGTLSLELESRLRLLVPAEERPALGALLRGEALADARMREGILRRWLERAAPDRPAVVWVDDAPWGPELLRLCRSLRDVPALWLLTDPLAGERPEALAALAAEARTQVVALAPLPLGEMRALTRSLVGLEPDTAVIVEQRAAGVPLVAAQLVGDWLARGLLQPTPRGLSVPAGVEATLPADLQALWLARLRAALPSAEALHALELAAALGGHVHPAEWRAVCAAAGVEPGVVSLPDLEQRGLVEQSREGGWRFAHGMLRESILARAGSRAADLHRCCAEVLAGRGADPGRLGRLRLAAGDADAAGPLLLEGAARRLAGSDYHEALALLRLLGEPLPAQGALYRAEALFRLGEPQAARGLCEEALPRAAGATAGELHLLLASIHLNRGDLPAIQAHLEAAGSLLAEAPPRQQGSLQRQRAWLLHRQGKQEESLACIQRAIDLHAEDRAALAHTRSSEAVLLLRAGRPEEARAAAEATLDLADSPYLRGEMVSLLAALSRQRGEHPEAARLYGQAAAAFSEIGSCAADLYRANQGLMLARAGQRAEGRRLLEAAEAALQRSAETVLLVVTRVFLLECAARQGDAARVGSLLEPAEAFFAQSPLRHPDLAESMRHAARLAEEGGWEGAARLDALARQIAPPGGG